MKLVCSHFDKGEIKLYGKNTFFFHICNLKSIDNCSALTTSHLILHAGSNFIMSLLLKVNFLLVKGFRVTSVNCQWQRPVENYDEVWNFQVHLFFPDVLLT